MVFLQILGGCTWVSFIIQPNRTCWAVLYILHMCVCVYTSFFSVLSKSFIALDPSPVHSVEIRLLRRQSIEFTLMLQAVKQRKTVVLCVTKLII
jgi:hypothetical protein